MIRISKGNKVQKIMIGSSEVSSVFIIPGVTNYTNVFTYGNIFCLSNEKQEESANIFFANEGDRFFGITDDNFKEGGNYYEFYIEWLERNKESLDEMLSLSDVYPVML